MRAPTMYEVNDTLLKGKILQFYKPKKLKTVKRVRILGMILTRGRKQKLRKEKANE